MKPFGARDLGLEVARVELALKLEPLIAKKGKENQKQSMGRGKKGCQKSDNLKTVDAKKELAKVAGVSHDTIAKGKLVAHRANPITAARLSGVFSHPRLASSDRIAATSHHAAKSDSGNSQSAITMPRIIPSARARRKLA